jgi:hypothetical protein
LQKLLAKAKEETADQVMGEDEVKLIAQSRLLTNGFEDGKETLIIEDYTEDEIQNDTDAVDWDKAYLQVEETQIAIRKEELQIIAE